MIKKVFCEKKHRGKIGSNFSESYIYKNTEEILDSLDIAEIERYLRKKKLERINSVRKNFSNI